MPATRLTRVVRSGDERGERPCALSRSVVLYKKTVKTRVASVRRVRRQAPRSWHLPVQQRRRGAAG